jgi:pimeloyl-ACP methyl ester carboxylesterase
VSLFAARDEKVSDRLVLMAPTMPANERSLFQGAWRLLVDSIRNPIRADLVIMHDYFFRCGIPYFLAQSKHLFGDRIETRLDDIAAKTLVIIGDKDRVVPRAWARRISDGIADCRLELVKGPHVSMYTDPARIAALISEHAAR